MSTTIFLEAAQHERPKYFNASLQWSKYFSLESEWSTRWSWFEEEVEKVMLWIFILPKTMLLFVVCHLARLFLREWWWGRQLQLEDAPYCSVMTSANSNITRSGLPLKEKTSFLLNNKKNNHLRQITLRLSFFSHHACEKSNTLQRPPLLSPSLSCEVLYFVSLRDPVVKILFDLLRLVQNS